MISSCHRLLKRYSVFASAFMAWVGIYPAFYGFEVTQAVAGAFVQNAQAGNNFGVQLLYGASNDAATDGQNDFNSLGMEAPNGLEQKLESYYQPGGIGMQGGVALNQEAAEQGQILASQSCPANWASVMSPFQQATADIAQILNICGSRISALGQYANTVENSNPTLYSQVNGLQSAWQNTVADSPTAVSALVNDCSTAPACDLASAQSLNSVQSLWLSSQNGFPNLISYCQSLPTSPNAQTAQADYNDLSSVNAQLLALTTQNQAVKSVDSTCAYATSYLATQSGLGGINGYTNASGSYGNTINMSTFLQTPYGQKFEASMMPFITGNPEVFAQYYNPADCTTKTTYFTNTGSTVATPSSVTIQNGSNPNKPVACNTTSLHNGWVTNFPDPSAAFIWGGYNDCQTVPNGDTETFEATLQNGTGGISGSQDTGSPISATVYLAIDDQGTLTIANTQANNTQTVSYNDNGQSAISAYPPNGWISQPVTIYPGLNVVTITDENDCPNCAGANPAGSIAAIINNANGAVLLDTNTTQWNWVNAPTTPPTTQTVPGSSVNTGAPSASAVSQICTNTVIRCLGTQCHGIIGNQNLDFNEAVTASSALSMMQTSMQCASGTSVAAGNCIPIIFQGVADTCRTWPFGGVLTNNCCKENLLPTGSLGIGTGIQLAMDTFTLSKYTNEADPGSFLSDPYLWTESAFKTLSQWGDDVWNYVSAPFVSIGHDIAKTFALGSSSGASSVLNGVGGFINAASDVYELINHPIQGLKNIAEQTLEKFGMDKLEAQAVATEAAQIINYVMIAYAAFEILQLITQLLTACSNEEYQLSNYRKEDDCYMVGTYCAQKVLGFCIMHKTSFCCYQSPLAQIISYQIHSGQPNVAGNIGTAQNPNCAGFTPQQLAQVNWSQINLSQWLALLEQTGMIETTNSAAAANFNPETQSYPSDYTQVN